MTGTRSRWLTPIVILAVLALIAQGIRPSLGKATAPEAQLAAPPEVRAVLERRCYACHSNQPQLAWFDHIVPAYWLVARDVRAARAHLNFSELGNKPAAVQRATLFEAVNQVQLGAMPLPSYLAAHRNAAVTPDELATLKSWLAPFAPAKAATPVAASDARPAMLGDVTPSGPSLNGVPFPSDYKQWQLISTTDRGDNNTLRIITGNDIAIRAIAARQTNPWPDGATFAKIAVQAVDDGQGHISAGKFVQVEFMEKDAAKYKSTQGWGFARWRGSDLKPYGTSTHFDSECTGCHQPMRDNDYVYTMPITRDGGAK